MDRPERQASRLFTLLAFLILWRLGKLTWGLGKLGVKLWLVLAVIDLATGAFAMIVGALGGLLLLSTPLAIYMAMRHNRQHKRQMAEQGRDAKGRLIDPEKWAAYKGYVR